MLYRVDVPRKRKLPHTTSDEKRPVKKRRSFEHANNRWRPSMQNLSKHIPVKIGRRELDKEINDENGRVKKRVAQRLDCSYHATLPHPTKAKGKDRRSTPYHCQGCTDIAGYIIPLCIDEAGECWSKWHCRASDLTEVHSLRDSDSVVQDHSESENEEPVQRKTNIRSRQSKRKSRGTSKSSTATSTRRSTRTSKKR